eukprot:356880-Chlamydomonas_euryale.AAC.2
MAGNESKERIVVKSESSRDASVDVWTGAVQAKAGSEGCTWTQCVHVSHVKTCERLAARHARAEARYVVVAARSARVAARHAKSAATRQASAPAR